MATFLEIATPLIQRGIPVIPVRPFSVWLQKRASLVVVECRRSLWHQVCVKLRVWLRNAPKPTNRSGRLNNWRKG
jgi:hypothetical protein